MTTLLLTIELAATATVIAQKSENEKIGHTFIDIVMGKKEVGEVPEEDIQTILAYLPEEGVCLNFAKIREDLTAHMAHA